MPSIFNGPMSCGQTTEVFTVGELAVRREVENVAHMK